MNLKGLVCFLILGLPSYFIDVDAQIVTERRSSQSPEKRLEKYHEELRSFRSRYGGSIAMPEVHFFLFGMGNRRKLMYRDGVLKDAQNGEILMNVAVEKEVILPPEYAVYLTTKAGEKYEIVEDEKAVYLIRNGHRSILEGTQSSLNLSVFEEYAFPSILRVLHHEILINIIDGQPVPNFFVYKKPWYRDAAMMAMVLKRTGNLNLIRNWVLGLREPYDRNNAGETEADNLGQALFLVSLVSNQNHPLVAAILAEFPKYEVTGEKGTFIKGRSDFAEHPVYQTKWAKMGLRALGLEDPYTVPEVQDSYASLFWMDKEGPYIPGGDARDNENYPYLSWATDHFHHQKRGVISDQHYPLTWERKASQAAYSELERLDPIYAELKLSVPHTWHAAEVFLFLTDPALSETVSFVEIPADVLSDKIRGGLLGQILGNLNGLPHEMDYIDEPGQVTGYIPTLPQGAWSDDDTDLEWVYITAMQRSGEPFLPADTLIQLWKRHINRFLWCSNRYARQLMDIGIEPPLTGRLALNPWAEFNISGQFVAESFGLVAPGMPQTAARLGLNYTHVTIDAEPAQTTQFFTAMIAMAFLTDDLDAIVNAGLASLDPNSRIGPIVRDVRNWFREHPADWRTTRQLIKQKYSRYGGEMRDRNGYELNTASTIAALLYGRGDFVETLQTAFNFGWDADNNAATAGTVIGVIRGHAWMMKQGWDIKDIYRNRTRDAMPVDETLTRFGDRLVEVAGQVIRQQGGVIVDKDGQSIYQISTENPANVKPLPDLAAQREKLRSDLLPQITKDLYGDENQRARAAYLAISLDLVEAIREGHPREWPAALDALRNYPKVVSVMFNGPPPLGPPLRDRAAAAGLTKPVEHEEWWY